MGDSTTQVVGIQRRTLDVGHQPAPGTLALGQGASDGFDRSPGAGGVLEEPGDLVGGQGLQSGEGIGEASSLEPNDRLHHAVELPQRLLDLFRLDSYSADGELVIDPTEELHLAVASEPNPIARAIEPGAPVINDEPGLRGRGIGGIAVGDRGPCDEQFPGTAAWLWCRCPTSDADLHSGDRPPDRNGSGASFGAVSAGPDGCFGRAVLVPQFGFWHDLVVQVDERTGTGLSCDHHAQQRRQVVATPSQHRTPERGDHEQMRDPGVLDHAEKMVGVGGPPRSGQHERPSAGEGPEQPGHR